MGKIARHKPVKLIIGFIYKRDSSFTQSKSILKNKFGEIDFESGLLFFTHTDYYTKEMGEGLLKRFVSFKKLIDPQKLAGIKILTNKIEEKFAENGQRTVNIDPGYLDMAKLVLASTKDYVHRIYIGKEIYSETTLFYRDKSYHPWEWSYPDYRTAEYVSIFNGIREVYAKQINDK